MAIWPPPSRVIGANAPTAGPASLETNESFALAFGSLLCLGKICAAWLLLAKMRGKLSHRGVFKQVGHRDFGVQCFLQTGMNGDEKQGIAS